LFSAFTGIPKILLHTSYSVPQMKPDLDVYTDS